MVVACVAVIEPSLLLVGYFLFYIEFQDFVRYLFPAEISIEGNSFILAGSIKEFVLFLALGSFLYRKWFVEPKQYEAKGATFYVLLILLTWIFVNIFRNDSPMAGLFGFRNYFCLLGFYFLGFYFIKDRKEAGRIIRACLISGSVLTAVAPIQIYHDPNFIVSAQTMQEAARYLFDPDFLPRITSLLSNPNALAQYLVGMVLFACAIWLHSGSRKEKLILIVLVLSALIVIAHTLSREAWLALSGALLLMCVSALRGKRYLTILVLALGVVCILYFLPPISMSASITSACREGKPG